MSSKRANIIVVGGGASGLAAALAAVRFGADVTLISLHEPRRSHAASIRVGMNAVVSSPSQKDSVENYIDDTYLSGASLAHRDAVAGLCESSPQMLRLLARMGVVFDKTREGHFDLKSGYGSTFPRSRFSGLSTGQGILSALDGQLRRAIEDGRVRMLSGREFISLITDDEGRCRGVVTSDTKNTKVEGVPADAVVMCTGGYQAIFASNTGSLYSDGSAAIACSMQGAAFANPEFSSIHPFTIGVGSKRIPIPESILDSDVDVWILRDGKKCNFLDDEFGGKAAPTMDDLSRAMWRATRNGGQGSVNVDFTHMDWDTLEKRFPRFLDICQIADIDPMDEPISVEPAVYHSLGGLWVDSNHATTMNGLFAAGSCACRYHGAGVLVGNEILSSLHGGLIAGSSAARHLQSSEIPASLIEAAVRDEEDAIAEMTSREEGGGSAHAIRRELGELLSSSAAIVKDDEGLSAAADGIAEMKDRIRAVRPLDGAQWANDEISAVRNVQRALVLAGLIVEASKNRCESRGSHYKPATPDRDDENWRVTTKANFDQGVPSIDYSERIIDVTGK